MADDSELERRVASLEIGSHLGPRIRKLEDDLLKAKTIAAFFGITSLGLFLWLGKETVKVWKLNTQIAQMDPIVKRAETELEAARLKQLGLIETQAGTIVGDLVKSNLQISGPYVHNSGSSSPKLIRVGEGFCFLTKVYGQFMLPTVAGNEGSRVYVYPDNTDGFWKLEVISSLGGSNDSVQGEASCVKYNISDPKNPTQDKH